MLAMLPLLAALAAPVPAQQTKTEIVDNNWGGKTEVTTDLQGNLVHQKAMDAKKTVREEKWVEYPNAGEKKETIKSYDDKGRFTLEEEITTKDGKRIKGTRKAWVYKDADDAHGSPGEEMTIDPDTGAWVRPIPPATVSLGQGELPNDFSVSYDLTHFPGETYKLGLCVDYSHAIAETPSYTARVVGMAEFSHPADTTFVHNIGAFLGGVRFAFPLHGRATPFAEITAGLIRWGTTDFLVQYGGGVDISLDSRRQWDLRVGGGRATTFSNGFTFSAVRLIAGIRHPF